MGLDKFSKHLKDLMEMDGLSKRALALKIDVDRASIRLWLSGRFYPRYDALIKLAQFFNVRIDGLIGLESLTECTTNAYERKLLSIEEVQAQFFKRIQDYMFQYNLTRYALAKRINIDQKAFTNWLTKGSMPETATIIRLAEEMNISVEELLIGD